MINWILPNLGTAAAGSGNDLVDAVVIDVRDLVDKSGNDVASVRSRIDAGVAALRGGRRVIVCCDYGISRSNAIAAGILASYRAVTLEAAVREVMERTSGAEIKIDVLQSIRDAREPAPAQRRAHDMRGQTVLLTGATGTVGVEIARRLSGAATVVSPGRKNVDLIASAVQLDLLAASSNAGCIAHFANPRIIASNRSLGESLTMLKNVLEVCRLRRLRLVYPSSWEVFTGYCGTLLADVGLPRLPKTVYGETKHLAELLIEHYRQYHGIEACILRSGPIYGAGADKPKFLHNFISKALANEDIYTHRYLNGDPGLDLVSVRDYAAAVVAAVTSGTEGTLHLGFGAPVTTREVAAHVVETLGSQSRLKLKPINDSVATIALDASRANATLSWRPTVPWRDGIKEVISDVVNTVRTGEAKE